MADVSALKIYTQTAAAVRLARRAYGPYKRQIYLLTSLSFVGGILEGIGINAVIPLITLVLGLSTPATDTISQVLKSFFEFLHIPFVPRYLLAFIVIIFMVK